MEHLLDTLRFRHEALFYFGLICLLAGGVCLLLTRLSNIRVGGVNAWYKPVKFALSITLFAWTIAWLLSYLPSSPRLHYYAWSVIWLLGLEQVYITLQAGRGQPSHFNVSTPLYAVLYTLMGLAAVAVALGTAYIGVLFWVGTFPALPPAYVWGIRIGLILFVLFALEGMVMGSRMRHTVGGSDADPGLPVVNWSRTHGDLRIAHFLGMHAIQILPLLAFYVLKSVPLTVLAGVLYGAGVTLVFVQALRGKPLWPASRQTMSTAA